MERRGGGYRIEAAFAIPMPMHAAQKWPRFWGQRHASGKPSHSHCRIQAVDHDQGVLLLVEIVGIGLRY
ncbi:hypothetical protein, partial [Mesorhizobium sp. M7A.F.Ca.CA.004.11.2.1]|uniref:hypothetical protein n=1 Tax=Mesorhizobium sp. M7A.F.Ca.CA.004.11.2.1 TaxID=2496699 RepID=UPI0019D2B70E